MIAIITISRRVIIPLVLILTTSSSHAQFEEDFNDGDLDQPVLWLGDRSLFGVNNEGQLQLDAPEAGTAFLYAETSYPDSAIWSMEWILEFPPSDNNYLRIYLQIDDPDPSQARGYFVEIGENGSDDRISLYRLDEGDELLLGSLSSGAQAEDPARAYFNAYHDPKGDWVLSANYDGMPYPQDETMIMDTDPMFISDGYFALSCTFTSQRVDKFFFDNISLQQWIPDQSPPQWQEFHVLNNQELRLDFDEVIQSVVPGLIVLHPDIGNPSNAEILANQPYRVKLTFPEVFQSGTSYTLILNGISDAEGNSVQNDSIFFEFIQPVSPTVYDLLINEIMFEPQEGHLLPDAEYVELYNPSEHYLKLDDMRLADEAGISVLPAYEMSPRSYLILTDSDDADLFEPYGEVLGVPSFPALNNTGDHLRLTNIFGEILHEHGFDRESYGSDAKAGAGWSIELINPEDPCSGSSNWTASTAVRRGTPGERNSVLDTMVPIVPLELLSIYPVDEHSIELDWSKGLDPISSTDLSLYEITPDLPISVIDLSDDRRTTTLKTASDLETGNKYILTILEDIMDCTGQSLSSAIEIEFGIPKQASVGEIVINELLFDPLPGGEAFIELLNTSTNYIDFENLYITFDDGDKIEGFRFPKAFAAAPESAVVLTPSPSDIEGRYFVPHPELLFKLDIPSPDQSEGIYRLYIDGEENALLLDSARYKVAYHAPFLEETEGVSLERLRPDGDGFSSDNWYSAAETVGYATPTGPNSQFFRTDDPLDSKFQLRSKTFSPDGDGFEDQLILEYDLDRSGYKVTVDVYDQRGYLIRHWIRNQSLGSEGFLIWNGADDEGKKSSMGMYILRIDLWHPDGERDIMKKVCVLATRMN